MKRLNISLVALLAAVPGVLMAQDFALDEIVVTANREATPASKVGATVTVVTEQDLKASGETSVVGYFRRLAGLTINTRGTVGTQSSVLLRGASQNYIAATVDGIDVTDPSSTQVSFDFGQLTTGDLSRVEVLKGSQSALYGAGAVGGVISFTTRRPTEDGLHQSVEAEGGSYNTGALTYGVTYRNDSTEAALTLSRMHTDGFSNAAASEGNTEPDGFDNRRLSFMLSHKLGNGLTLGLNGFAETSESAYDPSYYLPGNLLGGTVLASQVDFMGDDDVTIPLGDGSTPDEMLTRETTGLRATAAYSAAGVDHNFSLSQFRIGRSYHESEVAPDYMSYNDNGTALDFTDDYYGTYLQTTDASYTGKRLKAEYTAGLNALGGRVLLGADWAQEDFDQSGDYGSGHYSTDKSGIFAEYTRGLGQAADLTLSLRNDDHSIFGALPTARAALAYRLSSDTILRLQAGTGYRAPSNFELFSFYGSTTLEAEHSRNFDIGIEQQLGNLGSLRATVFALNVDNLIDFSYTSTSCAAADFYGPGCYSQVEGSSRRQGLELEGNFTLGNDVTLTTAYTYTDSTTNASTAWAMVPRHQISVSLAAPVFAGVTGQIGLTGAMDRPDWTDGSAAPDYAIATASLSRQLTKGTEAYLRVENLFDTDYQLVQHYGTSGRAIYLGLRASF